MPRTKALVREARPALNRMKQEVSAEFGIELGGHTQARFNGAVGGEMTKRLTGLGQHGTMEILPQLVAVQRVQSMLQ